MSANTIDRLQGLLDRVRRNAALPRPVRAQAAAAVAAEVATDDAVVMDEPEVEEPAFAEPAFAEPEVAEPEVIEAVGDAPEIEMGGESIEDLELLDAEIVDITEEPLPVELTMDEPDDAFVDEPPASSRRPKAAASMSEALAGAAEQLDHEGREIPLKTPPPESGPQEAPPMQGFVTPAVPRDLAHLDDDLLASQPALDVPTAEQLGATVDLEESVSGVIEIDVRDRPPSIPPEPHAVAPPAPITPEATARPAAAPDAAPAAFSGRDFKPETFFDLLDASLKL
jgi:hypothetical protein